MIPLTLRATLPPKREPEHWAPVGLTLGGVDWDGRAGYDVLAEPAPDTRDCPGNPLELDVWTVALEAWSDGADRIGIPAGVYLVPDELPPDTLAHIVETCARDWHECHSASAMRAERDDFEREE